MKALIIAAGQGNRLRKWDGDLPKPLYKVAGLTLIERAILSAKKAGITEFVVVIGYKGDVIRKKLEKRRAKLGVSIEFVENPDWTAANGHSVLKAKGRLPENFVLMMSDHVFDWKILSGLVRETVNPGEVVLAVDRRIDAVFDLPDATKVKTRPGSSGGAIVEIGKEISSYDAIDTGLFLCTPGLFPALERACAEGQGSLSEAIRGLASQGKARTATIEPLFWQDVDTPESLKHAEKILFGSVRKETDGFISRNINRRISGLISRLLIRTPLTPNQITWSALVVGLMSGFLISRGTYRDVALGGLIFQFASIYDGCDGEIAKLKLASSKLGEWLDTVCDNITYVAFFLGVAAGVYRQGDTTLAPVGFLMGFGILMTLGSMYFHLARNTNSGSLVTVQKDIATGLESGEQGFLIRAVGKLKFMMKRDFFALFFMALCLMNRLDWILILAAIGANLTWIVFLSTKRDMALSAAKVEIPPR
ncbi:MAG TPA: NTP transferase domain-containing protein [bacterium]|nr:NTP transferase domain-containing protein [bacterium]